MNAALIAQLIITLGPTALELIPKLASLWTRPTLTPEEVDELCKVSEKSYADYIAEARANAAR